jgi:hypothetical protein
VSGGSCFSSISLDLTVCCDFLVRHLLRTAAIDTMIQLSPASTEMFDTGRVMKVVDAQLDGAVAAFMELFSLWANVIKLLFMFMFVFYLGIVELRSGSSISMVVFLISMPFVMLGVDLVLLVATANEAARKDFEAMETDDDWTSFVVQASFMRQVVTTFRKGFMVTNTFMMLHEIFGEAAFEADMFSKKVQWGANMFPKLCQSLVAGYVGVRVVQGDLPVATFIVFLNTITTFGPTLGAIFTCLFNGAKD